MNLKAILDGFLAFGQSSSSDVMIIPYGCTYQESVRACGWTEQATVTENRHSKETV